MNIVVRSADGIVSLVVDEIGDVVTPAADSYQKPPNTLRVEERDIINSVCKLEGKLLLILDTGRVLRAPAAPEQELIEDEHLEAVHRRQF
jgi:purine-binding chemotaxis protein CheW